MKLLISFTTYPRDGKITPSLLRATFQSLIEGHDLSIHTIHIIVVGDDYTNIEELRPIFDGFSVEIHNINVNDALRNKQIPKAYRWCQAVQRSKIFILEKALEMDYDYILMSSDDDIYVNKKIEKSIEYIRAYNNPDLVFTLGRHYTNEIIPTKYNSTDLCSNYPEPCNCLAAGMMYNLKNRRFIKSIISFRKRSWVRMLEYIKQVENNGIDGTIEIEPEDAELWNFLRGPFRSGLIRSLLIPEVMLLHDTEQTIMNYIT